MLGTDAIQVCTPHIVSICSWEYLHVLPWYICVFLLTSAIFSPSCERNSGPQRSEVGQYVFFFYLMGLQQCSVILP
jgi:hypothetical protein